MTAAPHRAVIAFGSNLGDRAGTLHSAAAALAASDGVDFVAMSGLHESIALTPQGADPAAPAYLNAVGVIRTALSPNELLALLHRIEADHGRERTERWGDRTLDLDLIDYAGTHHNDAALTLPHPRAHERDFVLRPWLEIDPDAVLAGRGSVADLLTAFESRVRSSR